VPVQYCRLRESSTLLQKALRRASKIAPIGQIAVTAAEEYCEYWEPALWFTSPANRFIGENREASSLTVAAALLSIANKSPTSVVTVLPARCYVEREWILEAALERATAVLPQVAEGVVTLGMVDMDEGVYARRNISWVAHHLRQQGAAIASGITIGYAGAFAALR
jgi:mannose-1-phosphate guanylyltransferase